MNLLRIGDSFYIKKYGTSDGGTHLLDKLRNIDFSKFTISDNSKNYLMGLIDRKISSDIKHDILDLMNRGIIELVICSKEDGFPNYLLATPMNTHNGIKYYVNIGYYSKVKKETKEVLDIDPRVLFTLLVYGYGQYKIYSNPSKIQEIKIQDLIVQAYRKIMNKVLAKIVSLNTLTSEEKIMFDLILLAYIYKVLLRKDDNGCMSSIKTYMNKNSVNKDRLENIINSLDVSEINDFETFISYLILKCPSFKKISPALILREYTISMKSASVLSIDLIQFLIPTLMSIDVGSSGIFNDKFVDNVLDQNETTNIKIATTRM